MPRDAAVILKSTKVMAPEITQCIVYGVLIYNSFIPVVFDSRPDFDRYAF